MNYQNLLNHIESGHLEEVKIGKLLRINELNSYLKNKGVPEDSYSINEVNDESLCIVEENKKWHIFYSERGLRTEEYCSQDEHLAILYFINRLSKMLKFSFE